jgi:hypothetical protein
VEPTKPSNPKDVIGSGKLPLELIPDTALAEVALGFFEGASKYGRYNWRIAGVRASIYVAAVRRHIAKWWNGENQDPDTRIHHLGNAICCLMIILDAEICQKLKDDRPPSAPITDAYDGIQERLAYLKELFRDHSPHQYTHEDDPQ